MRRVKKFTGVVLSGMLACVPCVDALAENNYDIAIHNIDGNILFPGDSVAGLAPVMDAETGEILANDGFFRNESKQAMRMTVAVPEPVEMPAAEGMEGEEGEVVPEVMEALPFLVLEKTGYVLTVEGGTSKEVGTDGSEQKNHFTALEPEQTTENKTVDIAYYPSWAQVQIKADDPAAGLVFDHWETDSVNVQFTDMTASETDFYMPEEMVKVTAVYAEPAAEPEPVAEEVPVEEPAAEAPVEEPVAEVPVEEPVVEVPVEEAVVEVPVEQPAEAPVVEVPVDEAPVFEELVVDEYSSQDDAELDVDEAPVESMMDDQQGEDAPADDSININSTYIVKTDINGEVTEETYEVADPVTLKAAVVEGMTFKEWIISVPLLEEIDFTEEEITFTMPNADVDVVAVYEPVMEEPEEEQQEPAEEKADPEPQPETPEPQPETPEPQTEAPQTEAPEPQTEAPQTEAPEPQTEAPQTEAPQPETPEPIPYYIVTPANADVTVSAANAAAGDVVTITAADKGSNVKFLGWNIVAADNTSVIPASSAATTTFVMPAQNVTVNALYQTIASYKVTVKKGTGDGVYTEGSTVTITANQKEGYQFTNWSVLEGSAVLASSINETTTFLMPAGDVTVRAYYEKKVVEPKKFDLNVVSGSGDGTYKKGKEVSITADWPAADKEFDSWSADSSVQINGKDRFNATVIMPGSAVTVTALYKDGPNPVNNNITGIVEGGEYLKGASLAFQAHGAGMENSNPNPGDYRFKPTGYQIGSVTGGWNDNNFETKMAINAVGDYTLVVTFTKEVFKNGEWIADGTTGTKAVTFHVVNTLAVETGDTSPIIPLAIAAGVALLLIIIVVVMKVRKNK